jgi:protein-S-isoprenylcysteine O-methyltransferase Ste14
MRTAMSLTFIRASYEQEPGRNLESMLPLFVSNRLDALILSGAYLIWLVPEISRSFRRRAGSVTSVKDRFSGVIIAAGICIGVGGAFFVAYAAPGLAILGHRTLLFGIGIFLMLAGVAFRWYSIRVLGQYFSVVIAIQRGQRVIESGPYGYLRHPGYSGALLTILGLGLVFGNWLAVLVLLLFASLGYRYRILLEEQMLVDALGDEYRQYMKHTKRIIPFVI